MKRGGSAPELTTHTGIILHAKAALRNSRFCPFVVCPRCDSAAFSKWGIERQGRYPRQKWRCENGHLSIEPREWPFGRQFQSEPYKLLKAVRLMAAGRKSLQKVAEAVELDRYTIYKLHNHLGRSFSCGCGRPLGHRGHCLIRFNKSAAARNALDEARAVRKISKPSDKGWAVAERALQRMIDKLKEIDNDGK